MNINVSQIVADKLAQMETDGVVEKAIEASVEKVVLNAITSEIDSYSFRSTISEQVKSAVSEVASNCGFSAYNGMIAERIRTILQDMYTADIAQKVQNALDVTMLQKHETMKLSDIYKAYVEWVREHTDSDEQYDREHFTLDLDDRQDGSFRHIICHFADGPDYRDANSQIEIRFCIYGGEKRLDHISSVTLDGHNVKNTIKLGTLTAFEALIVNLYYNETPIILDVDEVDTDDNYFEIDC